MGGVIIEVGALRARTVKKKQVMLLATGQTSILDRVPCQSFLV